MTNEAGAIGTVTVTHHDEAKGTWLIALEGEHDVSTTPLLEQHTSAVWPRCTLAVVDLSQATFIDCSVINWLLRTRSKLEATGRQALYVVEGPPGSSARRVFDLPSVRDMLSTYPTRPDAFAQIHGRPPSSTAIQC